MTGGFILSCRAGELRGKLKHSYLENTLLLINHPGDLLEALEQFQGERTRRDEIEVLFNQLLEILDSADSGFSPAQLVDRLAPFQLLSDKDQLQCRARLHEYYRSEFEPEKVRARIEAVGKKFFEALDEFIHNARMDSLSAATLLSMGALRDLSVRLSGEVAKLPKGIWLWKT
jgi:hypothetical protein